MAPSSPMAFAIHQLTFDDVERIRALAPEWKSECVDLFITTRDLREGVRWVVDAHANSFLVSVQCMIEDRSRSPFEVIYLFGHKGRVFRLATNLLESLVTVSPPFDSCASGDTAVLCDVASAALQAHSALGLPSPGLSYEFRPA